MSLLAISKFDNHLIDQYQSQNQPILNSDNGIRIVARMVGISAGVLALATFSDPVAALVLCLTFWLALLLLRWPVKVMALNHLLPLKGKHSIGDTHLWIAVTLLLLVAICQQPISSSVQFWLLLAAVGYHIVHVKGIAALSKR